LRFLGQVKTVYKAFQAWEIARYWLRVLRYPALSQGGFQTKRVFLFWLGDLLGRIASVESDLILVDLFELCDLAVMLKIV